MSYDILEALFRYWYNNTMSNKRWGSDDKIELMRLYANGKSYDEIGKVLDRSPNAIKLRLEAIVYENLVKGKPVSMITRMLNTDQDTIKQLYYSHKSFRQGRNESVEDVMFPVEQPSHDSVIHGQNMVGGTHTEVLTGFTNRTNSNHEKHCMGSVPLDKHELNRHSVIKVSDDHNNIHLLEEENKVLKVLVKNYHMKRQLRKLYIDGKLDGKSIEIYEKVMKRSKN